MFLEDDGKGPPPQRYRSRAMASGRIVLLQGVCGAYVCFAAQTFVLALCYAIDTRLLSGLEVFMDSMAPWSLSVCGLCPGNCLSGLIVVVPYAAEKQRPKKL